MIKYEYLNSRINNQRVNFRFREPEEFQRSLQLVCSELQKPLESLRYLEQIHSDIIHDLDEIEWHHGLQGDGLITTDKELILLAFSADCGTLFVWDNEFQVIASSHSGYQGTIQNIAGKLVEKLTVKGFAAETLNVYLGPGIHQHSLWLWNQSGMQYRKKNRIILENNLHPDPTLQAFLDQDLQTYPGEQKPAVLVDNTTEIMDQLVEAGVSRGKINFNPANTFTSHQYHSYRRNRLIGDPNYGIGGGYIGFV